MNDTRPAVRFARWLLGQAICLYVRVCVTSDPLDLQFVKHQAHTAALNSIIGWQQVRKAWIEAQVAAVKEG